MTIQQKDFGNGFTLITLENKNGVKLSVTDLGARIVSLQVPKGTESRELILGFDSASEYLEKDTYIGATIGRVAGRIAKGQFELDGKTVQVETNNLGNTLHGGAASFEEAKWTYDISEDENAPSVTFTHHSADGDKGFPGNLVLSVTYSLDDADIWRVAYHGSTDALTLLNPTNHVYFNLTGDVTQNISEHTLEIQADQFLPTSPEDNTVLGHGEHVDNTIFDFRKPVFLSEVFKSDFPQKVQVDGIDHPFLLNGQDTVATLSLPKDGISVEVSTDEKSVVVFTASFGDNTPVMHGKKMVNHAGITFETQAPPGFEDTFILSPERDYVSQTQFKLKY